MDDAEVERSGQLFRFDPDHSWSLQDKGYRVTNGPAFSPDGRTMYHSDSAAQLIYQFELNETGEARNRRIFASFGEGEGSPDGMTIDAAGNLWVAFWDGWCLRRLSTEDRKSDVWGQSVSVRVALGGMRCLQKTKTYKEHHGVVRVRTSNKKK